jgi:hypothetical protein
LLENIMTVLMTYRGPSYFDLRAKPNIGVELSIVRPEEQAHRAAALQ